MPVLYMERSALEGLTERDIKKIIEENEGGTKYQRLKRYYEGDHAILHYVKKDKEAPNNKLVHDMPKYVTNTAVGYFIGKPVTYSSQDDAFLQALQDIFDYNDEQDENAELAKGCSISGSCFEMLYMDEDAMIRFVKVDPDNCVLIYETGRKEPMAALRHIRSQDRNGNPIKKVEFWTSTECWYFTSYNGGPLELTDIVEHYWQDVPFVEYINNEERLGDFEGIITLVDGYNRVQSNTANVFQHNDEAILKVLKMGDVKPRDIRDMKEAGAILLEDGGDIQWLIKEVADAPMENYKKRLREDMHIFSSVPNLNDEKFSGNLSGVALGYKLWGLEQICATKQEPEGKTYTEAQLQAQLEAAKAQWAAQQQEEARLSKLPPEERAKAEAGAQKKEVEDLRAQLLQRDLKDAALKQLEKDGFPAGLAELLTYTDKESMEKSMAHAQEVFKSCLEAAVKERLRGKTPEGLGGAASAENAIKDQIAQNIRGGLN